MRLIFSAAAGLVLIAAYAMPSLGQSQGACVSVVGVPHHAAVQVAFEVAIEQLPDRRLRLAHRDRCVADVFVTVVISERGDGPLQSRDAPDVVAVAALSGRFWPTMSSIVLERGGDRMTTLVRAVVSASQMIGPQ